MTLAVFRNGKGGVKFLMNLAIPIICEGKAPRVSEDVVLGSTNLKFRFYATLPNIFRRRP